MTAFRSDPISSLVLCLGILVLLAIMINPVSGGEAYCDACKGETGWNAQQKLDEIGNPNAGSSEVMAGLSTAQKNRVGIWHQPLSGFQNSDGSEADVSSSNSSEQSSASGNGNKSAASVENEAIVRSPAAKKMLAPMDEISGDEILLDISDNATSHIDGSIAIPYTKFLNGTRVKSVEELEDILGGSGITSEDRVIVYGECMPCGGGPAPATFVYWLLKSLGHEDVRVLDGMVEDWQAAGGPVSQETIMLPASTYASDANSNLSADYDYVLSGRAQIVDARTAQEFGEGSIPGALNYPYDLVISNNRIKDESRLESIFSFLRKDQPVVVYTNTGVKASPVWFALKLLGYDARLYTYEDYMIHEQAKKNGGALNAAA